MNATPETATAMMPRKDVTCELPDPRASEALGERIAGQLQRGDVVALFGDLGSGKTTLSRGVLRGLGHTGPVPSPTFTLVQHYETRDLTVAHFDLYRLAARDEIFELGLDEACHEGAVLIEWPEILEDGLPAERLEVHLSDIGDGRAARLAGYGGWADRLDALTV
jgi:tRNA threonylcarbamoyl adenosine modification protein YjeE